MDALVFEFTGLAMLALCLVVLAVPSQRQPSPRVRYRMHTSFFWLRSLVETDSLVGIGLAEGGFMSMEVALGRFGDRRLEKGGCHYMRPWFDGLVRVSDALPGTGRRRFGSRVFCAMKG